MTHAYDTNGILPIHTTYFKIYDIKRRRNDLFLIRMIITQLKKKKTVTEKDLVRNIFLYSFTLREF